MKIECSLEKLKNAILKTERVTSKNLSLPILNSILLAGSGNSLKLRATNLNIGIEIEIPAKVSKEGISVIKGEVLSNIFSNLSEDKSVILELVNDNLRVLTKNNNLLIKSYSHEDFPTIPMVSGSGFNISAKKFIDGIKSVYYSSSISDIKPEISSIYIYSEDDSLVFVATDSFRLAEKKIKNKSLNDFSGVLIPFKNITEIIKLFGDVDDDIGICFNKNIISISYDGIYLTSRVIDGVFPDYKQIIPKESSTEVVVLKQDLLNALKVANVFSDKFNQINLKIRPKEKLFEINSQNSDIGENNTKIEAALSGKDLEISFNYKYFLDCFQSISEDSLTLYFDQTNKPLIIKGVGNNSFTYLIMPMNR